MTKIIQLPNGDYLCRPTIGGKKEWIQHKRKGEVEREVAQLKEKQRTRRLGLPDPVERRKEITFDQLADKFLDQYQFSPRSKRTLEERLGYARDAFGAVLLRDLTTEALLTWNAKLRLGQTTKHNAWRALKQTLGFAVRCHYLTDNPATAVRLPGPGKRTVRPFDSWEQVDAVAAKAGRYGPLVRFACATGLRPQEWQSLEWKHIEFSQRELRVEQTVRDGKIEQTAKTDGSLRIVWLSQRALDALGDLTRPLNGGLIFAAPGGGVVNLSNFRKRVWKKALTDAKVEYRAIDNTRHTYATLMLATGAPIEWISEQLGHKKIQTTLTHYARWTNRGHARIHALIDSYVETETATNQTESGRSGNGH